MRNALEVSPADLPEGESVEVVPGRPDRILLVGVARSGTRWLATALGHASEARLVKEPDNVDADPSRRTAGTLGFGPYPVLAPGDEDDGFIALWDLAFAARVPQRKGARRTVGRAALRLPRAIRNPLLRSGARAISTFPGRPRHVVVKSIYLPFAVEWLTERYQPKVILIERNPLNVISSWMELGLHGFDLATRPLIKERYLDRLGIPPPSADAPPQVLTAWWVGLLTTALGEAADRHPEWPIIWHEALCEDPHVRIREVYDRLGLAWTEETDQFLTESNRPGEGFSTVRVTRDQPHRWRERLSAAQVDDIEATLEGFPGRGWIRRPPGTDRT